MLSAAVLLFWLIALLSYSLNDPAWSTSGIGAPVRNWGGQLGAWLSDASYYLFGLSVWWLYLAAGRAWLTSLARWLRGGDDADASPAVRWWQRPSLQRAAFWGALVVLVSASALLEWGRLYRFDGALPSRAGGVLGEVIGPRANRWLGVTGSVLIGLTLWVVAFSWVFRFSWGHVAEAIGERIVSWFDSRRERREAVEDLRIGQQAAREREREEEAYGGAVAARIEPDLEAHTPPAKRADIAARAEPSAVPPWEDGPADDKPAAVPREKRVAPPKPAVQIEPTLAEVPPSARVVKERQKILFDELSDSKLPKVDLLDAAGPQQVGVSPETLEMTSRLIEKKLRDFGVEVVVVAAAPGPVITRYEIEPATGVKGSQIVNLAKDLARSLSLVSIRVIETIPGKNLMALELPNPRRQTIKLSEILGSQVYHEAKSLLTMGLGKDIAGHPVVADLAKMPHCLVAGTTGSGKSVGINAMILSLLYKADAKDVRLLMIDPKMLELSVYEGIPHLLAPVVTDMKQAAHGLNWCVSEMEKRYRLMSKVGVRNLAGYNTKIDEAKARGESIPNPFSLNPEEPEPLERLPYIVVVIDELADLMMVVGRRSRN